MTHGAFVTDAERVVRAAREAGRALTVVVKQLEAQRRARLEGAALVEVVEDLIRSGGREVRMGCAEAFLEYEQAVASMRAGVVRSLVDDDGLSLTEVARRLRISRQAAARLYRQSAGDQGPAQA
jgi:hypothetical protein